MNSLFIFFSIILTNNDLPTSKVPYVLSLAGIAADRKLLKQSPTAYSVFCGMKLQEENNGKLLILSLEGVFTDMILF